MKTHEIGEKMVNISKAINALKTADEIQFKIIIDELKAEWERLKNHKERGE